METTRDQLLGNRRGQEGGPVESEPSIRRGAQDSVMPEGRGRSSWVQPRDLVGDHVEEIARGLGWFSIGLGVVEFCAPHAVERFLGLHRRASAVRLMGLREIVSGVGILTERRPAGWLWARLGGDVVDLASLGMALGSRRAKPANIGIAIAAVAGVTALDYCSAVELGAKDDLASASKTAAVRKSIQINRSPAEVYRFWRNFENLSKFMTNLRSVQSTDAKRSHWVAVGPGQTPIEWDAEIVEEKENELIAWRTVAGSKVEHSGSVKFEPARGGRGTFVKVRLEYTPPAGRLGLTVAKMFGRAPEQQVHEDLHHLKQILETGEIITTEGQPAGRARSTSWKYDQTIRRQQNSAAARQHSLP
jgi:uncharacterized membrane protein